jgi:hypothetical protein
MFRFSFPAPELGTHVLVDEAAQSYLAAVQSAATHARELVSLNKAVFKARTEIATLKTEFLGLNSRLSKIERGGAPCIATITDFYPSSYEAVKPLYVSIDSDGDEFVATFHDADVAASGETHTEALCNLKDFIVTLFEDLSSDDAGPLGPGPMRQLEVLKRFLTPSH